MEGSTSWTTWYKKKNSLGPDFWHGLNIGEDVSCLGKRYIYSGRIFLLLVVVIFLLLKILKMVMRCALIQLSFSSRLASHQVEMSCCNQSYILH